MIAQALPRRAARASRTVLVVDDDDLLRRSVSDALAARGFRALQAATLAEADRIASAEEVDVVVLDEQLPDGRGHQFCARLHAERPTAKIIFVTAFPEFEHAVKAIRAGAYDYLGKPFELEALMIAVRRCIEVIELEGVSRREQLRRQRDAEVVLVGDSPAFSRIREVVALTASSDAPVLITGETGTGKSLVAKAIHAAGPRLAGAFVPLSCAALPDNLVEAELFGWERGAFTGAVASNDGAFAAADGGTLFLDEIGELPVHLQPKLLTALEDREVRRLGGRSARPVDVRIVAATNAELESAIGEKRFRPDLYYRLAVVRIHVPPLRERPEDIPALAKHLLDGMRGRLDVPELDAAELERLMAYPWPGNVRELRNVLERAVLLQRGELRPSALIGGWPVHAASAPVEADAPLLPLAELERHQISEALRRTGGNLAQAARLLGISLSTLKRRVRTPAA